MEHHRYFGWAKQKQLKSVDTLVKDSSMLFPICKENLKIQKSSIKCGIFQLEVLSSSWKVTFCCYLSNKTFSGDGVMENFYVKCICWPYLTPSTWPHLMYVTFLWCMNRCCWDKAKIQLHYLSVMLISQVTDIIVKLDVHDSKCSIISCAEYRVYTYARM